MSQICPECKGAGRKKIGFFRTKVCGTCNGKGCVRNQTAGVQQQPFFEDEIISVPFASTENHHVPEEPVAGHGGAFGGGGAGVHWDNPQGDPSLSNDSFSSSSDSSGVCSSDGGGSGGGD